MLSFLPSIIIFPLHLCLQLLNIAFWALLIIFFGLLKFLLPLRFIVTPLNHLLNRMLLAFAILSIALLKGFNRVTFDYHVDGKLSKNEWYLMLPNHLSWLDIVILTEFAARKIPAPKFFLKQELIWLPFVGLGAWALDMPFMQRYSANLLAQKPHLKGKDIATTKKSCEKFKQCPTTVINFVEGSRFTAEKHHIRQSPFKHLLPPKAGGIAFTLAAMGHLFTSLLDVTILYPNNTGSAMLNMLAGRLNKVVLRVKVLNISDKIIGDYFNDPMFKQDFQTWLNQLWFEKDQHISQLESTPREKH